MQFKPSNKEDISKYYRNSYLKLKESGDTLYYLQYVDSTCVSGQRDDGREFKLWLAEEEPYEVDYILPHKSFFQHNGHAMMLQRIPAKQYHRGLTGENTMISFKGGAASVEQTVMPLSFELLKAFVSKQKFYTLSEAVKLKPEDDVVSAVLAQRMMYMVASRTIHIDFVPVARVNALGTRIQMVQPIFQEEIEDFLKSTQESKQFTFGGGK